MGLPTACDVLREALFRGADRAVLLTDRRAAASDTLATSYILSCAVKKIGADIVLCGRQAIDGDTAQVGPQVAEKLGLPQITCVSRIGAVEAAAPGAQALAVVATRSIEGGYETLRAGLPALLTITAEANEPRPASVKLMLTYKNVVAEAMPLYDDSYLDPESDAAEVCMIDRNGRSVCRAKVVQWDAEAIGAEEGIIGLRGSPTRVKDIESVVLAQGKTRLVEPTAAGVTALVHELVEEHILG